MLTLNVADKLFANPKRINLLQQIAATGSISQGAKLAGISYKSAWDAIHAMNHQLSDAVVISEKGGKGGGGAKLTTFGKRLLKVYTITGKVQDMALKALLDEKVPMQTLLDVMAHFSLKTSARNQLTGTISAVDDCGLRVLITVTLTGGQSVQASITHASYERLKLTFKQSILLLFKAPSVTIVKTPTTKPNMNSLVGRLQHITTQNEMSELTLDIGGNDAIYSIMPSSTSNDISFKLDQEYYACFEISQAIIASMDDVN